ncbi:hypothetical protein [Tenacibaculum mesophilum]|uniref:hypothetical protein n=1 Tax=Tenacibaculum mesophilum TaxID=104268 RepID=UPI00064A3A1A|nr:hypothetical protein [Tenacibaculum mesophilum]
MRRIIIFLLVLTVSCKQQNNNKRNQKLIAKNEQSKTPKVNNLPFGNEDLIKYEYNDLGWFDELHFGKAILGYRKLKELNPKIEGEGLEIPDIKKTFYLPNNIKIEYIERNTVNYPYGVLYRTGNYSLCYVTTIGKDMSEKVFNAESEEANRGYLVTIDSQNNIIAEIEVLNTTEYFTQSYKGEYLGAMYIQNEKVFFVDENLHIYVYDFLVKGHDLSSEYKLLSSEEFTVNDTGSFIKKSK